MSVFGAVFGRKGDGGFSGPLLGACSGDGGFMLACISGCRGVIGCKVATGGVLRAKKFALLDHSTPNSAFCACWASFFAEMPLEGPRWANFVAPIGPAPVLDIARRTSGWLRWGFAPCEAP